MATLAAFFSFLGSFFSWKAKTAPTPTEAEIQAARKERDDELQYNADAVRYGVDPVSGRVRYPADK
ncbi:MAG: hypothetical protein B9S32_13820 [Verrucomicrobia bacterium Tous-C9LFEB]|nr:MAG: hypothetical protein B9S32_13820 [Verrucomicrobia bacterium Tous-C9LFEB]